MRTNEKQATLMRVCFSLNSFSTENGHKPPSVDMAKLSAIVGQRGIPMNIQDLGALGEIVGAIAIVATLAYLAVQIRYAKIAVTDQSRQNRAAALREINGRLVDNSELRQVFDKVASPEWQSMLNDLASAWKVSLDEASLIYWSQNDYIWTHWAQYYSQKTKDDERELENIVSNWYSAPPMKTIIEHETVRLFYEPEFIRWIDSVVAKNNLE